MDRRCFGLGPSSDYTRGGEDRRKAGGVEEQDKAGQMIG